MCHPALFRFEFQAGRCQPFSHLIDHQTRVTAARLAKADYAAVRTQHAQHFFCVTSWISAGDHVFGNNQIGKSSDKRQAGIRVDMMYRNSTAVDSTLDERTTGSCDFFRVAFDADDPQFTLSRQFPGKSSITVANDETDSSFRTGIGTKCVSRRLRILD